MMTTSALRFPVQSQEFRALPVELPVSAVPVCIVTLKHGLTRRRSTDAREECWHIYYGDVLAGTIGIRSGNPHDEDPWGWHCGFYPGCHPGQHQDGTAASFHEARADFEAAWLVFLTNRTEADFKKWRDERDWIERKYALWDAGEKLPSQKPSSLVRCPCGEVFDTHAPDAVLIHVPHISAASQGARPRAGRN